MPDSNIEILQKETYLKMIENSVGSKIFNSVFVRYKDSGKVSDILDNGEFSCAFYISGILSLSQMIDAPHTTVSTLLKIIKEDVNWIIIKPQDIEKGDVVFWDNIKFEDGSENAHVGFALSKKDAVSTDYKSKKIIQHQISNQKVNFIYRYQYS